MTVTADQKYCLQIWVVAKAFAKAFAEVAADITTDITAEVLAEAASRTKLNLNCNSGDL